MGIILVFGIFWLSSGAGEFGIGTTQLVLTLGVSLGVDVITTGMIAGRLIYYHRLQRRMMDGQPISYLSVLVIFIESAVLSTVSKVVQLILESRPFEYRNNPIVIPLTVSLKLTALVGDL
jgi:hypothetical protein